VALFGVCYRLGLNMMLGTEELSTTFTSSELQLMSTCLGCWHNGLK
jgi:hypothetical protein